MTLMCGSCRFLKGTGSYCDFGGSRSLVAPRWTSQKTFHCVHSTGSIGICVHLRVDWTAFNFLTVSMDGQASSGDGFSDVLAAYGSPEFWRSVVRGPVPTNCSAWRWQQGVHELKRGILGRSPTPTPPHPTSLPPSPPPHTLTHTTHHTHNKHTTNTHNKHTHTHNKHTQQTHTTTATTNTRLRQVCVSFFFQV